MKIISYRPGDFLPSSGSTGRVGSFVASATPTNLSHLKPGIAIVGLACDAGVKNVGGRPGAAQGPAAFRKKFYRLASTEFTFPIYDLGDVPGGSDPADTHSRAHELLLAVRRAKLIPLVIGGGHDLAFPEATSLLDSLGGKPANFLNIDAHLDVRPTTHGITSGSPWYMLAESKSFQASRSRIYEFGIQRNANTSDLFTWTKQRKISVDFFEKMARPEAAFRRRIAMLGRSAPLQVSLDIDSVQWSEAPGVSAPQTTGFKGAEAIAFSRISGAHAGVLSFGIYELNPAVDRDDQTAALVARCALAFLEGFASRKRRR